MTEKTKKVAKPEDEDKGDEPQPGEVIHSNYP